MYDFCQDGVSRMAMRKYRSRECTRPVNGGRECLGAVVEKAKREINLYNQLFNREEMDEECAGDESVLSGFENTEQTWRDIMQKISSVPSPQVWLQYKYRGDVNLLTDDSGRQVISTSNCPGVFWEHGQPDDMTRQSCLSFTHGGSHDMFCSWRITKACESWVSSGETEPCQDHYVDPNAF